MEKKYIALIILNYNNFEDTINCIESVEKYNTYPIKIIIVDNGSTRDRTITEIDSYLTKKYNNQYKCIPDSEVYLTLPYITFVVSKTNDGYARGNNKGLKYAFHDDTIEQILILNNDVLFVEDVIGKLVDFQQSLPDCAIISPVLFKKDMTNFDLNCARLNHTNWEIILTFLFSYKNFFGFLKKSEYRRYLLLDSHNQTLPYMEVELPSGSCMLFQKSLMNEINIFDENTFLYYEENILFKQISRLHKKNYIINDLKCIHLGASSTSRSRSSFVAKCGLNSADYYLKQYCTLTFMQKIFWNIAKFLFIFKLKTIRR